ncbi:MAG: adenylyl-sulfate kinase [Dehalococcoidia bacterium]
MSNGGFVLWFTGLSGSGKSTLAEALAPKLRERAVAVEVLDGDEVRTNLSKGLGFSKSDRDTNILRIGYVAKLLSRNGVAVIAAAISPYAEIRDQVRTSVDTFIEVHTDCSIDALIERDTKGLYKLAIAGEIENFTGISDPYEAPQTPELRIDTEHLSVDDSLAQIIAHLERAELIPVAVGA